MSSDFIIWYMGILWDIGGQDNKYLLCVYGVDRKSVTRVTERHHEACRVMPNSDPDPEWQIFLSTPYIHDRYFFLHTFWFTTFDFQSRTWYELTLFPLKGFT